VQHLLEYNRTKK